MKKYKWAVCIALFSIAAVLFIMGFDALKTDPLSNTVYINDPKLVLNTQSGRTYIASDGATRIMALDENARYIFSIPGGKDAQGFYYAQSMVADANGNLFLQDRLLDDNGKDIETERIMKFDSSGKFQSYLHEEPNGNITGENRNRLHGLALIENELLFVRVDTDSFSLCKIDPVTGIFSELGQYSYAGAYHMLMGAAITPEKNIYFVDKFGSIWLAAADGSHTCIYDAAAQQTDNFFSIVTEIAYSADGCVYFNDIGQREICRILPDGTVETVVGQSEPLDQFPQAYNELPIYSALSVTDQSVVTAVYCEYYYDADFDEHIYDYKIYSKDSAGNVLINGAEVEKSANVRLMSWLSAFSVVLLLTLAVWVVWQVFASGWLKMATPSTRLQAAVIAATVFSAVIVAFVVIEELNTRYIDERSDRITSMARLIARDFDAEDINSINAPDDYNSEAYQRIDASVREALESGSGNDGTYCLIYKTIQDISCIIYYDEGLTNIVYPMPGGLAGTVEEEIYETGTLHHYSSFSNADGHYTYTMAPVTDDDGKVIAIIEVGADLYAVTAANTALIRETVLTVLMLVVTGILLFSEGSIFANVLRKNRMDKRKGLMQDVGIIRPIAFLVFFAGDLTTSFLPVHSGQLWEPSMGFQQEFATALPISVEICFAAIFSVLGGFIVDRIGVKRLVVLGGITAAVGQTLCGTAPQLWTFLCGSVLLGTGNGLVLVALNTFIANYGSDEEQTDRGFSGYNAAYLSGMNCGTVVGSLLAEQLGFRPVFFIAGAMALLAMFLAVVCLHKQTAVAEQEQEETRMSTIEFLLKPRVFIFFIFMLMPYLISSAFLSYFFPVYGEENGLSPSFVAQAFLLSGVIAIYLGPPLTRLASARLGSRMSLILSTGIYVASFALFAANPSIITGFIIIALLAIADSFGLSMQAVYFSALPEVQQYGAGKAMGINSAVESIAQTVGPMIFASILMLGVERGVMLLAQALGIMLLVFIMSVLKKQKESIKS